MQVCTYILYNYTNFNSKLYSFITLAGIYILTGPLASVFVKAVKSRLSQLVGGGCVILGLGLSTLSTEPWHAYILYSVLVGKAPGRVHD